MRVARYRGEKNLTELAKRLYRVDATGAPPKEAVKALEEANGHLDLAGRSLTKRLSEGTLIAVPELDGMYNGRSSKPRTTLAADELRARATYAIARALADAEVRDKRESMDIDEIEKTAGSGDFANLVNSDDRLKKKANQIGDSIRERRARLDYVRERRAQALRDASERIEQLVKRAGG